MKKIVLVALMALCVSSLNAKTDKVLFFSVCMAKFKNALFCEIFAGQTACQSVVNDKIIACHRKYKDPKDLKEICDKMEDEEWRKCKDFNF